jgi:hypothetical protein
MAKDNPKLGQPPPTVVRNKRLKVSPGGIVTLPVAARKALGIEKGAGSRVTITINDGAVTVASSGAAGGFRVSPGGQLELRDEARSVLNTGARSHYWIELQDAKRQVRLHPYR